MFSFFNLLVLSGIIVLTREWLISNSVIFDLRKKDMSERPLFGIIRISRLYLSKGDRSSIATCNA